MCVFDGHSCALYDSTPDCMITSTHGTSVSKPRAVLELTADRTPILAATACATHSGFEECEYLFTMLCERNFSSLIPFLIIFLSLSLFGLARLCVAHTFGHIEVLPSPTCFSREQCSYSNHSNGINLKRSTISASVGRD